MHQKRPQAGVFGILAEFDSPGALYHGCEHVRDAGFRRWDAHTPFPVHGLSHAMGIRGQSRLGFVVIVAALTGGAGAMLLQWWTSAVAYPLIIAGKPLFSWQAFVPVTFEVTVLFGALAAVIGMLAFDRLPQLHHPIFRSKRFERFSDDRFFISIEASDPNFDAADTAQLLERAGAIHVEVVEE